jgi:hypothetical protein
MRRSSISLRFWSRFHDILRRRSHIFFLVDGHVVVHSYSSTHLPNQQRKLPVSQSARGILGNKQTRDNGGVAASTATTVDLPPPQANLPTQTIGSDV